MPGETARLVLLVSTDDNPGTGNGKKSQGQQEYTSLGVHELNSGATLNFIDPVQDMQLSVYTDSVYVTVIPP